MTTSVNATTRDSSSASPDYYRFHTLAYSSPKNRDSYASSDTAESSNAASQRLSQRKEIEDEGRQDRGGRTELTRKDGRGNHRSHRGRTGGGFLLSNSTFEAPAREITPPKEVLGKASNDYKGKNAIRPPGKRHRARKSDVGSGLRGSPLAGNVTTLVGQEEEGVRESNQDARVTNQPTTQAPPGLLDVDSAQIVNLALNLSQSRQNVSRRLVSNPLPSPAGVFPENMAGGSLRYHMQQQRRSSRNVSPKPDRHSSFSARAPSGQRLSSPLQPAFDETSVSYHFSASTLARAEKAKQMLELMAQYREVLQYLPPLKPQKLDRILTGSTLGDGNGSPVAPQAYKMAVSRDDKRSLGRQYNPLQYIRNRKVRARTSRSIDGEAQGFGDLEKVAPWVAEVAKESSLPEYQEADCLVLPALLEDDATEKLQTSPQSTLGRNYMAARSRRPRMDWMINPADMLADVFWLEQEDNKKLIEDRFGRRIFPDRMELRRPISRQQIKQEPEIKHSRKSMTPERDAEIHSEVKLPEFKSVKQDPENFAEKGTSRAKEKLRHVRDAALQHTHGSGRDVRHFLRSRSRSDSSSSDSESDHRTRRQRSGTADTDRGKQILEKQLSQLLENDRRNHQGEDDPEHQRRRDAVAVGSQESSVRNSIKSYPIPSAGHSRSASFINRRKRDSIAFSSGRASLEVPRTNNRGSIDLDFDSTAPSSPEFRATRANDAHVPNISMSLSPPHSRHASPQRSALSKIKAKIRPHHARNELSDHSKYDDPNFIDEGDTSQLHDEVVETRRRSISPVKRVAINRSAESANVLKMDTAQRDKTEDPSGIRGFLKSARHPVNRVSEIIWRKDSGPGHGTSSGHSSDESDSERPQDSHRVRASTDGLAGATKFDTLAESHPPKQRPSYLDSMPAFTSASEARGRPTRSTSKPDASGSLLEIKEARIRRMNGIQTAASNSLIMPKFIIPDWDHRGSSDTLTRKAIYPWGARQADSRLNAVLGLPGKPHVGGPHTGLTEVDAHGRRPSLQGKRQWSLSDQTLPISYDPTTRRDIARVRALLLSSGIKAKEIKNRAHKSTDFRYEKSLYAEIISIATRPIEAVPHSQKHLLASEILTEDIQLSCKIFQDSASIFSSTTMPSLHNSIETLQSRVSNTLTPLTRKAADEADEVSKDIVTSQTLNVKRINDKIERMIRGRKRRFRWLRRGGWVLVEWTLVGVMWYVWFLVVLCRIVLGIGKGLVGSVRWLLFL